MLRHSLSGKMGGRSGYDVDPGHPVHVYEISLDSGAKLLRLFECAKRLDQFFDICLNSLRIEKMDWNIKTKEKVQYSVAVFGFVFGLIMVAVSAFAVEPIGEVDPSVISILGILISFAAAIFGVSLHYDSELQHFKSEARDEFRRLEDELERRPHHHRRREEEETENIDEE